MRMAREQLDAALRRERAAYAALAAVLVERTALIAHNTALVSTSSISPVL